MPTSKNILKLIARNMGIALAVILVAAVTIGMISREIERVSDAVALNHRLEAELRERVTFLKKSEYDTQTIGTHDMLIENAFVSSDNISAFTNALDDVGQKKSIMQTYNFETPVVSSISAPFTISRIAYTNRLTVDIATFSTYLKEFERLPYFTTVESIDISSQGEDGWNSPSTISLRAALYTKTTQ